MKDTLHTADQWQVGPVLNNDRLFCAEIYSDQHACAIAHVVAIESGLNNAKLLAAAPDMLAALHVALDFMLGFEDDEMQEDMAEKLYAVRSAIIKAGVQHEVC